MSRIQFRSDNPAFIEALTEQLTVDLQQAGLETELQIGQSVTETDDNTRGDSVTLITVALAAVGTGGALSVLLGKDGFLSSLARVLEKYVEGRKVEVLIETDEGKKIQLSGPVGAIKAILSQINTD